MTFCGSAATATASLQDGAGRVEGGGVCDWRRRECDLGGAVAGDGCGGQVVGEGALAGFVEGVYLLL